MHVVSGLVLWSSVCHNTSPLLVINTRRTTAAQTLAIIPERARDAAAHTHPFGDVGHRISATPRTIKSDFGQVRPHSQNMYQRSLSALCHILLAKLLRLYQSQIPRSPSSILEKISILERQEMRKN